MYSFLVELSYHTKSYKEKYNMDHKYSTTKDTQHERGKHLKFEERCSIKVYRKLGYSQRYIARELNCSPATISYELRRGTGERNGKRGRKPEYSAKRGQAVYEANRSVCHRRSSVTTENPFVLWLIGQVRNHKWSIDACVGYAKKNCLFTDCVLSTKTIYNAVWNGTINLSVFDLPEALSRKTKKHAIHRNKRCFGTGIDERPTEAASREEYGHWEIDTVVGHKSGRESVVLTLVEKKCDYYIAIKIPGKDSVSVMTAMDVLREEYGEKFSAVFKTITADNGTEFEGLAALEKYGTKVYFAHPYSSWERPQNERHNRIFRRFVPKGVSIDKYSAEQILQFADSMNALPRRLLNYCTPEELFDAFLDSVFTVVVSVQT